MSPSSWETYLDRQIYFGGPDVPGLMNPPEPVRRHPGTITTRSRLAVTEKRVIHYEITVKFPPEGKLRYLLRAAKERGWISPRLARRIRKARKS